jgi:hypothetical protein
LPATALGFSDFPDRYFGIGGRFDNYLPCRGEHLHILTFSLLAELLELAGFEPPVKWLPVKETGYPELFADCLATDLGVGLRFPHTPIVEARKPVRPEFRPIPAVVHRTGLAEPARRKSAVEHWDCGLANPPTGIFS